MTFHQCASVQQFLYRSPELGGAAIITVVYALLLYMSSRWTDNAHYEKVADLYEEDDQKRGRRPPPVPPGSLGLPVIGDTITFMLASHNSSLRSYFDKKVEKYGDIFKVSLVGRTTVFLDLIHGTDFLFNNERQGDLSLLHAYWPRSFRVLLESDSLLFREGPTHRVLKNHWTNNFFGVNVVHRHLRTIEKVALKHICDNWPGEADSAVVLANDAVPLYTFDVLCELCLGVTDSALLQKLRLDFQVYAEGFFCLPLRVPGSGFSRACQAKKRLLREFEHIIGQRRQDLHEGRASPTEDFLCVLLTQPDETGHLCNHQEIMAQMLLILFAGQTPSENTLTQLIGLIARHPEVYEKLVHEHAKIASNSMKDEGEFLSKEDIGSMQYSWQVLQETLRLSPVSANLFREAATAFQYKGLTIKRGWKLAASAARVRSDPETFREPDTFDPARFENHDGGAPPYSHFPFGGGLRMCPGNEFAKQVVFVFLHHLLKNARLTMVDLRQKIPVSYTGVPFPARKVPVKVTRCKVF